MRHCRFRTWSPRLAITTAVIVTGVVGAPIARADNGADLGVPSQAGVAAAVADAVVPAVTVPESPVAVAALPPESLPPVAQAAEAALQLVSPSEGADTVVPSQAEQPPPPIVAANPSPPPASPTEPSTEAAPPLESPAPGARAGDSAVAPDLPDGITPAGETAGDITAAEPTTSGQPEATSSTAATQLGPVNIQVSIRIASPGDNGAVTQVNAVVTAAAGSAAPLLDDRTDHASSGGSSDIGRDITGSTVDSSSDDRTQDPTCDPEHGCCEISFLAGTCLGTGIGALSPQDLASILDAIFGNASANGGVTAQYQGDAIQYRPINISVSIRISSPGNDGPVDQTNLVHVQTSISVDLGQAVQQIPGSLDATIELAPADADVAEQEPLAGESESVSDDPGPADIEASTTDTPGVTVLDSPFPLTSGPVSRSLNAISRLAWGVGGPPSVAWITAIGSPGTARYDTAGTAADKTVQRRASRAAAPPAPPAHPWVPVVFSAAPASASSGGGGGGGGLAVALSLPFVLALFYSGLRRLRTSGSVPSAHIDREPERPG